MSWLFPPVNNQNCRRYDDRFPERHPREAILAQPAESPGSAPIGKPDVPGDVIVKAGKMAQWRGVDRNKPAIAHEMTRTGVKDHNPTELKIAVIIKSLSKETGSRLRVDQFWPKVLNLA